MQITEFSVVFMKINCLRKLMKFQYNICIADQKQQQRMVKYLNQLL